MNPVSITYSAIGPQPPISMDWRVPFFNVSYGIYLIGPAVFSLTVDRTLDDVTAMDAASVQWTAGTPITATFMGSFMAPFQFMRINISAITAGSVTLRVLQGCGP